MLLNANQERWGDEQSHCHEMHQMDKISCTKSFRQMETEYGTACFCRHALRG